MVYEPTRKNLPRKARQTVKNIRDNVMAAAKARRDIEGENTQHEPSDHADAKGTRVSGNEAAETATGTDAKATTRTELNLEGLMDSDSEEESLSAVHHYQRYFGLNPANLFEKKKEVYFLQDLNRHDEDNNLCRDHYGDNMTREKIFQKIKMGVKDFRLDGLSASEIDTYRDATISLVTCYNAKMQEQFFEETIGEKVRGQLTEMAESLPIRGRFKISQDAFGDLYLDWKKMSMRKFHEYLEIIKDFSNATKSGEVDLCQQAKTYVHTAIQRTLDINICNTKLSISNKQST